MIKKIIFALGSNLGDRKYYLQEAISELKEKLGLVNLKESSILENKALLLPNSPPEWDINFLNMVISADIDLKKFPPIEILNIIKKIERKLDRKERLRWAPREIDIDILTIEELTIKIEERLLIPHYDLMNRNFLLKLIEEIEPNWVYNKFNAKI
jgi:2-amino-4-hydroxy-6-hydroxymethyldihydropteridine diphosphokinase